MNEYLDKMRFKTSNIKEATHSELVSCVGWASPDDVFSAGDDHLIYRFLQFISFHLLDFFHFSNNLEKKKNHKTFNKPNFSKMCLFKVKVRDVTITPNFISLGSTFIIVYSLKGVFAKNERGYRLNAIKKRF